MFVYKSTMETTFNLSYNSHYLFYVSTFGHNKLAITAFFYKPVATSLFTVCIADNISSSSNSIKFVFMNVFTGLPMALMVPLVSV